MKLLILLLLLATTAAAQDVQPILSNEYLRLVNGKRAQASDSSNNLFYTPLHLRVPFNASPVGRVIVRGNDVSVRPPISRDLFISGIYGASIDVRTVNKLPELQHQYVQGRPVNGMPAPQGPETNELFSFGPDINTLTNAHAYANKLFRAGTQVNQSLNLQLRYRASRQSSITANIRMGRTNEALVLPGQTNTARDLSTKLAFQLGDYELETAYTSLAQDFSLTNRAGGMNRVYQNDFLTPVSFDNRNGAQRSYSAFADNPFYLLSTANGFRQHAQTGLLSVKRALGKLGVRLVQTIGAAGQDGTEKYGPAIVVRRTTNDLDYQAHINTRLTLRTARMGNGNLESTFDGNYIWSYNRSTIDYEPGLDYRYRRAASDASLAYNATYTRWGAGNLSMRLANKVYASSTTEQRAFFLPDASLLLRFFQLFGQSKWTVQMGGSWNRFNNEPAINNSFASTSLLRYRVGEAGTYFPVTEASGFNGLSPMRHREASVFLEIQHRVITFHAELFDRYTRDDVFAVNNGSSIQLMNVADDRNRGLELEAKAAIMSKVVNWNGSLSFFTNRNTVTAVRDGFEGLPVAGFSDVHKSLVTGQQLGAVVGSRFLRNTAGQLIIGADGFPLVNPKPGVIGRVNPDFVVKTSQVLTWKSWDLNIDVEWRKGGQVWNGTQALLDYYGRSAATGAQRNISGYVFNGVQVDGHSNTVAVRFYDPSLPVEQNRWTRYGIGGVAEDYMRKADNLRLNVVGIAYHIRLNKYVQSINFNLYANNIILWSATPSLNGTRLLYDAAGTEGLDLFNLPSLKTFGFQTSIQF